MISSRVERVTQALAAGHQDRGLIVKIHGFNSKRTKVEMMRMLEGGGRRNVDACRWDVGGGCEER